jgi:hypothetical protein
MRRSMPEEGMRYTFSMPLFDARFGEHTQSGLPIFPRSLARATQAALKVALVPQHAKLCMRWGFACESVQADCLSFVIAGP